MVACCRVGAVSIAVHSWAISKEVAIIFITSTIVWHAEKDWGWVEKGTAEDEMIGWPHPLNGHEFE